MKKIISIILSIILLASFVTPCFAMANLYGERYIFTYPDGTTIEYYLDDNAMPFIIKDGEKMALAIPLPHLQITDVDLLNELNSELNSNARVAPTEVYCLTIGDEYESNVYTSSVSFASLETFITPKFLLDTRHEAMRIKTTNLQKKSLLGGSNVSFVYRYCVSKTGTWYYHLTQNVSCTGTNGYGIQINPTAYPYGRVELLIPDNITACTLKIWTVNEY